MSKNTKTSRSAEPKGKVPVWEWTGAIAATDVPPMTKLVCLNIARYLSSAGKGWRLSIKQMKADTGLSNRSLATHLENAENAGLLVIQRMPGPNGQRGVTLYKPRFPDGVELSREPAEMPGEECSPGPSEPGSRGPREGGSLRTSSPREAGSLRPREGASRQEAFHESEAFHQEDTSHKEETFQERGRADARSALDDDVCVVEAEIIDPAKTKASGQRKPKATAKPDEYATQAAGQTNLFGDGEGYRPGKSMMLAQAMDTGWAPGEQGLLVGQQQGFSDKEIIEIFEAFKAKYGEGGVAERTKSTNWWKPWEAYVKSWSRIRRQSHKGGSARGGRGDKTAGLNF